MAHILFFATKDDLLPILDAAERKREIKYVKYGGFASPIPDSYESATIIPGIGRASSESSVSSDAFLICSRSKIVRPRKVSGPRYLFDQLENPETITFTPGGLWGEDILLNGRFATASTSNASSELLKIFQSLVRKRFKKIKAFYVGEEAEHMLDQGKRLTEAEQSPRLYDLSRA